jgi:hypothetical protein
MFLNHDAGTQILYEDWEAIGKAGIPELFAFPEFFSPQKAILLF